MTWLHAKPICMAYVAHLVLHAPEQTIHSNTIEPLPLDTSTVEINDSGSWPPLRVSDWIYKGTIIHFVVNTSIQALAYDVCRIALFILVFLPARGTTV